MDKIRLNIPFNFAVLGPFHLFSQAPFSLGTLQTFWTRTYVFQTTKFNIVLVGGTIK